MTLINKIKEKLKYGTLIQSLLDKLGGTGIQIIPCYWIEENSCAAVKEEEGRFSDYVFEFFGSKEIRLIGQMKDDPYRRWFGEEAIQKRVVAGNKCFGAKYKGEIAAFMWINFKECPHKYYPVTLKNNEAYIFDSYTIKKFRGKGIASHMHNQAYHALNKEGIDRFYSIVYVFNTPAVKSKKRLNAKFLKTILYIRLFKKYSWRFTLRDEC